MNPCCLYSINFTRLLFLFNYNISICFSLLLNYMSVMFFWINVLLFRFYFTFMCITIVSILCLFERVLLIEYFSLCFECFVLFFLSFSICSVEDFVNVCWLFCLPVYLSVCLSVCMTRGRAGQVKQARVTGSQQGAVPSLEAAINTFKSAIRKGGSKSKINVFLTLLLCFTTKHQF